MEISRNNYEEYFLDYWENRLDKNSTGLLMAFVEKNPDLQEEFWSFENVLIIPTKNVSCINKSAFKKPEIAEYKNINESNYLHYFVLLVENDLSMQEIKDVNGFISLNPFLVKEMEMFKKTLISPDNTVVYPEKESLKKKAVIKIDFRRTLYWSVSAAASIAIAIVAYFGISSVTNEKFEVVRLIHEKKVDNFRSVVFPENYKKQVDKNDENLIINKNSNYQDKNNIKPADDYIIDEMVLRKVQIKNSKPETEDVLFTEMYYQDNLADYINYIKSNADLKSAKNKNNMSSKIEIESKRFTFWDIAEAGVKGYNVITNKKVDFKTQKDKDGKLTYIALGKNLGYSRSKH